MQQTNLTTPEGAGIDGAGKPNPAWPVTVAACIGYAAIVRRAFSGDELSQLTRELVARVQGPVIDPGALLDLATVLICQGGDLAVEGRLMQMNAIRLQRNYQISHGTGLGLRILAFVTAGDFMANTPLDFLLHGSDAVLLLHFVDAQTGDLADLPAHDVAFMAIGESPETAGVLQVMARLLAGWHGPIFNRAVASVAGLTRDGVSRMLGDEPGILAPANHRLSRQDLLDILLGPRALADFGAGLSYPLVLRPVGSHAGVGMQRISDAQALAIWLRHNQEQEVYLAPFIDYRGPDGLYAKQRVVLIKGHAFASHLACSAHWMVHYLNADMTEHASRRATEAAWMAGFDHDFARRHATALAALYRLVGLDYFGIDCAEAPDGRLLVFELDVAMIVHDMDSAVVFPYKKPVMQKLFSGFLAALDQAAKG